MTAQKEGNDYDGLDDIWKEMTVALECSKMKNGKEFLLTDTVGFIQKLPTTLVAAFRATLEEISESSLLVHVVDISHPLAEQQIDAVDKVLSELDVASIPKLMVWNKIDKASDPLKIKLEAEKRQDTEIDAGFIPMIRKTVFAMHIYCFWYMLYYSSVFGSAVIYILCGPLLLGFYYSQNNYGFCSSRVQLLIALNNCGIALTCAYLVMGSHGKKVRYEGKVDVTLQDGQTFNSTVIYADGLADIAIVKINFRTPFPAAKLGSSHKLCPGD
ncbi:GTPase HflX [Camellia lanceoleosa]|uniref:GTPase HflX n=1 Tax=Camellia lanceoleosa TaxID=1840588 RepID=A0ACC0F722_9ERIC|nr:GTPase HflX [Camellia lanceoleosa]